MQWYVPPARAMGTFLRTWRSEWASLSRAQLATSVAAHCSGRHRVTPDVIREWEDGQPPQSTDTLNALLLVMRVHGLSPTEVTQFRDAVFAACAGRRFPELFDDAPFALRTDVDEVAEAIAERPWWPPNPFPNVVALVACLQDLQHAVLAESDVTVGRAQERRQQVALAYLGGLLPRCHCRAGRRAQAAAAHLASAEFLGAYFGRIGLSGARGVVGEVGFRGYLSVPLERLYGWYAQGHVERPALAAQRLLAMSEEAWAQGDSIVGVQALFNAHRFGEAEPSLYSAYREQARQYLVMAEQLLPWVSPCHWHHELFYAALGDGLLREAEGHLARMDETRGSVSWLRAAAHLAHKRGDYDEAMRLSESALALARREEDWTADGLLRDLLKNCERALGGRRRTFRGSLDTGGTKQTSGGK